MVHSARGTEVRVAAALFPIAGSGRWARTLNELCKSPAPSALRSRSTSTVAPLVSLPRLHVTRSPVIEQLPFDVSTDTRASGPVSEAVSVTACAKAGPRLRTLALAVNSSSRATTPGADADSARSAFGFAPAAAGAQMRAGRESRMGIVGRKAVPFVTPVSISAQTELGRRKRG